MYRRLLIIGLTLLIAACVRPDPQASLDDQLKLFSKAMRWGHYDIALAMTHEEESPINAAAIERLRRFNVTNYEEVQRRLSSDNTSAEVIAEMGYTDINSNRVQSTMLRQKWLYQEERDRWYLSSGMPEFR